MPTELAGYIFGATCVIAIAPMWRENIRLDAEVRKIEIELDKRLELSMQETKRMELLVNGLVNYLEVTESEESHDEQ